MWDRRTLERELTELGAREFQVAPPGNDPTLGFEFDLNYGVDLPVFNARIAHMPLGSSFIDEHQPLTTHTRANDGFETKRDGPRLEISTMPFKINDDATFEAMVRNVGKFAEELQNATKTRDTSIRDPDIAGHPTFLEHPKTVISHFPLVIHAVGSKTRKTLKYPTGQNLWAAPQATITLPLSRVGRLIYAIDKTAGGKPGVALTGPKTKETRLGLRTDLAMTARVRVLADRRRRFGTTLSDNSKLTEADYSPALTSFVTILVMYMLTSEKVDPKDADEGFAKGSLPLNVKTPLWEIFKFALSAREQFVFNDLYGAPDKRAAIYKLARPGATALDGLRRLFPQRTHGDLDRFHAVPLNWSMLVHFTVNGTPLKVSKVNTVKKKNHKIGDQILFAPLSSKIDFSVTDPLIAIEMRRLGFEPVGFRRWEGLMRGVRQLARELNR